MIIINASKVCITLIIPMNPNDCNYPNLGVFEALMSGSSVIKEEVGGTGEDSTKVSLGLLGLIGLLGLLGL